MYTHTSGVDHEQGSLSLVWGGSGALPREKIDFRDGWRTILSLFYGRKFVFFQEIFYKECSCLFFFHITHVRSVRNGRYAFALPIGVTAGEWGWGGGVKAYN